MTIRSISPDEAPWPLLLMADPSRERVRSYVEKGVTFAGEENGKIVAAAVVERSGAHFELKNIAVSESHQGTGLGRQLLRHVL